MCESQFIHYTLKINKFHSFWYSCAGQQHNIEGMHGAVCTYKHKIVPCLLVSFLYWRSMEKNNKTLCYFWFTS